MLKLNIKATNIKLDDALYKYIYEKIGTLDKFIEDIDGSVQAWVEVGKPSRHHQTGLEFYAEVDIRLPGQGKVLRSESRHLNLHIAIDQFKDELQRELKQYKGRQEAKYKRGARVAKKLIRLSPLVWFKKKKREREEEI
jgi:ribosomal subunit interface protein